MKSALLSLLLAIVPAFAEWRSCELCHGQGHRFSWWCLCHGGQYHTCVWCNGRGVVRSAYGDAKAAAR